MGTTESKFLTINEVCVALRCSRITIWRMTKAGKLAHVRVSGKVLIPKSVVENFHAKALEAVSVSA